MKPEYDQLIFDIRHGITVYKSCKRIGIQHVDILSYMKRHPELLSRYQCEVVQAQALRVQAKQAKIDNSKPGTVTPELFDIILHAVSHGMTYIEAREKYGITVSVLTSYKNATPERQARYEKARRDGMNARRRGRLDDDAPNYETMHIMQSFLAVHDNNNCNT